MPGNLHSVPAAVVASWPKPNYIDPVRRAWMPAFSITLASVSTVLVAARLYLRARRQAGAFGWDDLLISIGLVFSIVFTATACINTERYGLDRHTWDVRYEWYVPAALVAWLAQLLFLVSTAATKCSVLLFYRRLVKDTGRWKYAIWAALIFTGVYSTGLLIGYFLVCQPLEAYWESYNFAYDKSFKCIDGDALSVCVGVVSVVSDVYAAALPFAILKRYNLDVTRRQRIGLNVIFSLSLMGTGAGIARTYYLWELNHTYDTSWAGFNLFVPSLIECHLAIICACAPSLRALLRRYVSEPLSRSFGSSGLDSDWKGTKESQMASSIRTSQALPRPAKRTSSSSERGRREPRESAPLGLEAPPPPLEKRVISSPQITSAEDYEAYNMSQLRRHGYRKPVTVECVEPGDDSDPKWMRDAEISVRAAIAKCSSTQSTDYSQQSWFDDR